ncbi:MAG: hypothetical protein HY428_03195 [Candidatus Levybacteria bacterium]|nr:hypothetical protein [Candidatus Levybacteria bacterium]
MGSTNEDKERFLLTTRKDMGSLHTPSSNEIAYVLKFLLPAYEEATIGAVRKNPERYSRFLADARDTVVRPDYFSFPFLACYGLDQMLCTPVTDTAIQRLAQGDVEVYFFEYDIAFGASSIISEVLGAEAAMRHRDEEAIYDAVSFVAGIQPFLPSEGDIADEYLRLNQLSQRGAKLLETDPTGFTLIDNHLQDVTHNRPPGIIGRCVPEYFIAGAELGSKLYKEFYKLAENLPQQVPQ